MDNLMLKKAIEYADRGWKVFPLHTSKKSACSCGNPSCSSAAKHPRIKEWQKSCSDKLPQIEDWWKKWPDANIGLATGNASGFFVIDIDPRHGGKESLQDLVKKNGVFPKTLASNTGGGGYHLFFKEPNIRITNRINLLPGIDIRGDGGYVVAPPSFHHSGAQYSWTKDLKESSIQDAPNWLLELFLRPSKPYTNSEILSANVVQAGGRNNFLTREAGKLRRKGFDQSQLLQELRKINENCCVPPLDEHELLTICASVSRYPAGNSIRLVAATHWSGEPGSLAAAVAEAPPLSPDLLPECVRPWIMDVSERMQVTPEFVMAPALVSFSSVVGKKIGIYPKEHDDWLVIPNLWGLIVARPGYFKSPTIAEAMKPLEKLSEAARRESEANLHFARANQMFASMQLEAMRDLVKQAIKSGTHDKIEELKTQIAELEMEAEAAKLVERRYKTNDATVEKIARLLNENPNGLLLMRDELNGWLQLLSRAGREGDREFFLESWNGYGSYTVDRVGSGTLHVPSLCLSIFGGIQPGKLQAYVEKTIQGLADDDGLLQRFQILIYPDLSSEWKNVDRSANVVALQKAFDVFQKIDSIPVRASGEVLGVRFSSVAQEAFNNWRDQLENRLRSNEIGCPAFESHLAKYRSLMPSLALLFWILEDPENINGKGAVSFQSAHQAIQWCAYLEKHALKAYSIGQNTDALAAKRLTECIEQGLITHGTSVRSIYRRQWGYLRTPELVDRALETLEELNWLRVIYVAVQGGRTKKIELHPKFRRTQRRDNHEYEISGRNNGALEDNSNTDRRAFLGANHHQI